MPGKPSVPCCCTHSGMSAPRHLPPASPSWVCAWWQPGDLPPSSWCALPAMADLHGEGPKLLMASVAEAGCGAPCSSLSCSNSESTEMEVTSAKSSIPPEPFCPLGILERGEVERVRWVARRHPGRHSLPPARSINGAQFTYRIYISSLPSPSVPIQGRRAGSCARGCFLLWVARTPLSHPVKVAEPRGCAWVMEALAAAGCCGLPSPWRQAAA